MPSTINAPHKRDLLLAHFNGAALPIPSGGWWVSLHTASPAGGGQTTNEATYGGYTRQLVGQTTAEWSVADSGGGVWVATLITKVAFPARSDVGTQTITHIGLGDSASGAGVLRLWAPLASPLFVAQFVTPRVIEGTTFDCEC